MGPQDQEFQIMGDLKSMIFNYCFLNYKTKIDPNEGYLFKSEKFTFNLKEMTEMVDG